MENVGKGLVLHLTSNDRRWWRWWWRRKKRLEHTLLTSSISPHTARLPFNIASWYYNNSTGWLCHFRITWRLKGYERATHCGRGLGSGVMKQPNSMSYGTVMSTTCRERRERIGTGEAEPSETRGQQKGNVGRDRAEEQTKAWWSECTRGSQQGKIDWMKWNW